jgi:hypothetical protein
MVHPDGPELVPLVERGFNWVQEQPYNPLRPAAPTLFDPLS